MAKKVAFAGVHSAEVVEDLADAKSLLASQTAVGLDETDVLDSMFKDILAKIRCIHAMSAREKNTLTVAIGDGPWTAEQKKVLATVVRGETAGDNGVVSPGKRKNQRCVNLENWVDDKSWVFLKTPTNSRPAKTSVLAMVMSKCGIELPCEKTLYRGVAILNYCDQIFDMFESDVRKEMDKLQNAVKQHRRVGIPFMIDYPHSPSMMPHDLSATMFPKGVPVDVCIPELDGILQGARMRGRRNTSSSSMTWLQHVPIERRSWLAEQLARESSREHTARLPPYGSPCKDNQWAARPNMDVQLPTRDVQRDRKIAALMPWSPPTKTAPVDDNVEPKHSKCATMSDESEDDVGAGQCKGDAEIAGTCDAELGDDIARDSVSVMEARLLAAHSARASGKKPASKKARRPKTPSAVSAAHVGKPRMQVRMRLFGKQRANRTVRRIQVTGSTDATKGIDMTDVFDTLRKRFKDTSRESFTSCAYKNGKNRAIRAGVPAAEAAAFGRAQFLKASQLWAQLSSV